MYALRTRPAFEGADGYQHPAHSVLIEMRPAEWKAVHSEAPPEWAQGFTFAKVTGERAHAWVKAGRQHETGLYLGEDRRGRPCVRYAKDGV